ncbi:MAG: hypothetical protein HWE18_01755 [Gammaproteobacteria bacterium]|nr:hypothetical protein [Gammaproteobacteria bacterium]
MNTEMLIIIHLAMVLLTVTVLSIAVWRKKSEEINELDDVNQALLSQIEELQALNDDRSVLQEQVSEDFQDLDDTVEVEFNENLEYTQENINELTELVKENQHLIQETEGFLKDKQPDIEAALQELIKLKALLNTAEKSIDKHKKKFKKSEENSKELKAKVRTLSKKILTLGSLEVSEGRLKKDKTRLMERIAQLKDKYESQKVIEKNLKNELKTSFRASEVQAMRENLKQTEEKLKQTMIEKAFIEQHFLELAHDQDPAELDKELKRVKRELKQLEKGIIDMSNELDN